MKKVLKSVVAVVLCLAMVLSLAACGPKYTNGISTEEFTDKKTGVSYKGRIKIGAAIARTGAYSLVGEPYGGFYDLYVRYINEELGGVAKGTGEGALGYKLEATTYDDQGDGAQGNISKSWSKTTAYSRWSAISAHGTLLPLRTI